MYSKFNIPNGEVPGGAKTSVPGGGGMEEFIPGGNGGLMLIPGSGGFIPVVWFIGFIDGMTGIAGAFDCQGTGGGGYCPIG